MKHGRVYSVHQAWQPSKRLVASIVHTEQQIQNKRMAVSHSDVKVENNRRQWLYFYATLCYSQASMYSIKHTDGKDSLNSYTIAPQTLRLTFKDFNVW